MRVYLCGVRGSTPAPGPDFLRYGGHTPCIAIARDDQERPSLILDAGTGIREASALMRGEPFAGTILLTHLHWDHLQGLPFFTAGDDERASATLLLPEQEDGARAEAVLERAMSPPHFPMTPSQLRGSWRFDSLSAGATELEGLTVLAREIPHKGGRTFGYRVSDGRSTLTYMPDHCPTALGAGPGGCGEYHPAALELARGAELLVHDAQLTREVARRRSAFRTRRRRVRRGVGSARRGKFGSALPPPTRSHRRGARSAGELPRRRFRGDFRGAGRRD